MTLDELASTAEVLDNLDPLETHEDDYLRLWNKLRTCFQPLGVDLAHTHLWHRARRSNDSLPFTSLYDLIYRANGCSDYGRAQKPGSKVLYAGSSEAAALDEINARSGETIQLVQLRTRKDVLVIGSLMGEYARLHAGGTAHYKLGAHFSGTPKDELMKMVFVDSFIAKMFRQDVAEGCNIRYKPTAVFAESFLKNTVFTYPSVKNLLNSNIAVSSSVFDTSFEVISTLFIKILEAPGFSIYKYEILDLSSDFAKDGTINWHARSIRPLVHVNGGVIDEGQYLPGWRVG